MSVASVVVLAHALIGIVFIVGLVGRWIVLGLAARADDLPTMKTLTAAAAPFERIVIVGSTVVLVFGIVAAFVTGRSILGPFTGGHVDWLFVSVLLYLSNIPLIPLVFVPRGRAFGAVLADADRVGTVTPSLRTAWADPVTRAAHVYELATATIVLSLMLTKPF